MVQRQSTHSVSVIWRGKKFLPEVNSEATVLDLGEELQKLTDVKADTIRLIVPQSSSKSSLMLSPFSDEHSCIRLQDTGIFNGRPLRMMGVLDNEVDQLLNDSKVNLRIPGFEEEEKRMKERLSRGPRHSLKLPEGPYVFCGFRTLEIPGVELNPPPLEALKRMHMLAADPGIVAIMNKHRWRVGIMTEMAPIGYVGVSPMCLLGLNKNQGEEISLRLRTDDLKGFRKYESIKKTLLHELLNIPLSGLSRNMEDTKGPQAHMVWSEHDENFYALDKLLNQEAFALDWTRSRSHTLADTRFLGHDDFDMDFELESSLPRKLGGETSVMPASARFAAVAAAYHRLAESSTIPSGPSAPKTDDSSNKDKLEPDPDDSEARKIMILEPESEVSEGITNTHQPNCGDTEMVVVLGANMQEESDPDDSDIREHEMPDEARSINSQSMPIENNAKTVVRTSEEPDPDDAVAITTGKNTVVSDTINGEEGNHSHNMWQTPDSSVIGAMTYEPDPDDEELKRVHDPVTMFCDRLTKAIEMLRNELNPSEVVVVQQTLFKIIGNVSENPNEMKYKRLRKANPLFQRSVANCKAALEVLFVVGFVEEVVTDQTGKAETYLVLKRNDPGLLWLAKSFLETISAKS